MKSKILVDYDFDRKETFLQLRLEGWDVDGGELPDKHLKAFVERANEVGGMTIQYFSAGNGLPQIRVGLSPEQEGKVALIYDCINQKLTKARGEYKKTKDASMIDILDSVINELQEIKEYIDIDLGYDYTR